MDTHLVTDPEDVTEPTETQFELAVDTFKLGSDVTQLKIVWALLHGEHSVTELAGHLGVNPPAVSQQLAKLRAARLIRDRQEGNRPFYVANNAHVRHLVEQSLFHADHVVGGVSDDCIDDSGATWPADARRGA